MSICVIYVLIGTLTGSVTFPLGGMLAINFAHGDGEASNNCGDVERVFPIKGKKSQSLIISLNALIIRLFHNDFLKSRSTQRLREDLVLWF